MSKQKREDDADTKHKKAAISIFKSAQWLKELVETEMVELKISQRVELGNIFHF